jgi:hypothetical protein
MNSLPLISHHLFVAAIKEDNESPPKYAPGKTVLDLPEPAARVPLDRINCALTLPVALASNTPEARVRQ